MEKTIQGINHSTPRDYDKDPIVIEDYNPLFKILMVLDVSIWFFGTYFSSSTEHSTHAMYWLAHFAGYSFIPAVVFYFYFRKSRRKVLLKNNVLMYQEDTKVLEMITFDEIHDIRRTFNDYYRKEQNINPDYTIRIFLGRLISPIEYLILLVNKVLFHMVKNGLSAYKLFDAILIMTADGRVINILPTNNDEYKSVRNYFLEKKSVDVVNVNTVIKFNYKEEEKAK